MANHFLLPAILALFLPQPALAMNGNYLLSGQTLNTNDRLLYNKYSLIMEDNCNLVIYGGDWQSNTSNKGRNCTLTLTNDGELVIKSGDGSTVWTSNSQSSDGFAGYTMMFATLASIVVALAVLIL